MLCYHLNISPSEYDRMSMKEVNEFWIMLTELKQMEYEAIKNARR